MKVLVVLGTRPEAIKLAPVIRELQKHKEVVCKICVTAQHREMLDQVIRLFLINADYDLDIMTDNQSLCQVASRVLKGLEPILQKEQPDWLIVQGDTTTAAVASIAAFYNRIQVAHVEAGLRTGDKWQPYPKEINRRIISVVADLHFAPTERARQNLIQEGVPKSHIFVTGNTVIDALLWVANQPPSPEAEAFLRQLGINQYHRLLLVTVHRRENFGQPLRSICSALLEIANMYRNLVIVYPVHRNPNVWNIVHRILGSVSNIILTPPLDYETMVHLMKRSYLILTDSGGIQEEAPSLGVPVLVLREITERPEAIEAGTARVIGTHSERIIKEVSRLLDNPSEHNGMRTEANPYGDGHAAKRIVARLLGKEITLREGVEIDEGCVHCQRPPSH